MTNQQEQLFATLVEHLARGMAFDEDQNVNPIWAHCFEVLVEGLVLEAGGTLDDEEFVTRMKDNLGKALMTATEARVEQARAEAQAA